MKTLLVILVLLSNSLLLGQTIKGKYNPDKNSYEVKDTTYKVSTFQNGVAEISKNERVGLITTKGKVIIPLKYVEINVLTDNLFATFNGKKWGVVNKNERIVLPHKYDGITWYEEDSVGIASIRELEVVHPTGTLSGTMFGWGYYFDDSGLLKKESVPVKQYFGNVSEALYGGYSPISLVQENDYFLFSGSLTFYLGKHNFSNTVYDLGEKTHLTSECEFYFECDCCSNQLLFNSDSTFLVVSPCTQDVSISHGTYEVLDNTLYLYYSGVWHKRYTISDEQDRPAEYDYKTNKIPAHTEIYSPEMCQNTTLFTQQNNTDIKIIRSQESLEKQLVYLKKVGLFDTK